MLLVFDNFPLVHRRIQAGSSRGIIGIYDIPFCVPGRAFAKNACSCYIIRLVDYYGRVRKWSTVEAEISMKTSLTFCPDPVLPLYAVPSTASAGPILLKFWLETRKSVLNKVRKFQIPTSNRLGVRIQKPPGGGNLPPQRIGLGEGCLVATLPDLRPPPLQRYWWGIEVQNTCQKVGQIHSAYRVNRNGRRLIFPANRRCALTHHGIFTAS